MTFNFTASTGQQAKKKVIYQQFFFCELGNYVNY